jgi:hypothetical protein
MFYQHHVSGPPFDKNSLVIHTKVISLWSVFVLSLCPFTNLPNGHFARTFSIEMLRTFIYSPVANQIPSFQQLPSLHIVIREKK